MASFTTLVAIFAWIFMYSIVGFYLFHYSFEGATTFVNFRESYWNMLTLLTTANFPDIMLPACHRNYFIMLFFISYLLLGLFFLLNFLLASVFNKFKQRLAARIDSNEEKRKQQVFQVYKMFDVTGRGYLYPS